MRTVQQADQKDLELQPQLVDEWFHGLLFGCYKNTREWNAPLMNEKDNDPAGNIIIQGEAGGLGPGLG